MVQDLWNVFKKKNFFFHPCPQRMNHTDNLPQWTFLFVRRQEILSEEAQTSPTSWFWNYSSRHETKLKNQRDLLWKKKNGGWPGNQVSTHLAFVLLDEDAWIKRVLGNVKELTVRAKRRWQSVYHIKKKKKKRNKSVRLGVSPSTQPGSLT